MIFQLLINGIILGSTYALLTSGYALLIGALYLLNLAHADTFMIGAFLGLTFVSVFHMPFFIALILASICSGVLAIGIYFTSFRFVKSEYMDVAPFLSTIAMGMILQTVATEIWGTVQSSFPETIQVTQYHIGPIILSSIQLIVLLVANGLMVALYCLLTFFKVGKAFRAICEDSTIAQLLGVKANRIILFAFFISGVLAGVAGVLIGFLFGAIEPFMGVTVGLKGIGIMVLGGLGNVVGAMVAAMIMGVAEVLTAGYFSATYRDAIVWGVLILVLLLKPGGLFGTRIQEGR